MQNYALLEVAGRLGKPVLLKRGLSSSLDELPMAGRLGAQGRHGGGHPLRARDPDVRARDALRPWISAVPWLKLHTRCDDPQPLFVTDFRGARRLLGKRLA